MRNYLSQTDHTSDAEADMIACMKPLTEEELQDRLAKTPVWKLDDGNLVREWTFADFPAAIAFVQQVAVLAQQAEHHPDIDIRYNRVRLALSTHDEGGITERDFALAGVISAVRLP